jgi:hypothetical protein
VVSFVLLLEVVFMRKHNLSLVGNRNECNALVTFICICFLVRSSGGGAHLTLDQNATPSLTEKRAGATAVNARRKRACRRCRRLVI